MLSGSFFDAVAEFLPDREVAVDAKGTVHLIYFKGDPRAGEVFYRKSLDAGGTFSEPLRVNSQPGSVMAIGSVRGSQLAIGKNGRVHVAWNGTDRAQPAGPQGQTPLLYTRLGDDGAAFEPQRNIVQRHFGLDGGAAVAADQEGHVYVAGTHRSTGLMESRTGRSGLHDRSTKAQPLRPSAPPAHGPRVPVPVVA